MKKAGELSATVLSAVREALAGSGTTCSALASRIGKTEAFVNALISGERDITMQMLERIADALQCRVYISLSHIGWGAGRAVVSPDAHPTRSRLK